MKIQLIAVGKRMPDWVDVAVKDYQKRLPKEYALDVISVKTDDDLLTKVQPHNHIICCDEHGELWSTKQLSAKLSDWHYENQSISILIGGPDGLPDYVKAVAHTTWSLSPLTFPHPLVRIIVAEQLYRAYTLIIGHPYHRA